MSTQPGVAIGLDIGGTKVAGATVDKHGAVLSTAQLPTPANTTGREVLDAAAQLVEQLSEGVRVHGVGVGAAGVIDVPTGTVTNSTDLIKNWKGTRLAAGLAERTGLPARTINDVHAHALGEAARQEHLGEDLLFLAVGTGIGGSYLRAGIPDLGAHGVAGHMGHVPSEWAQGVRCSCGALGHVEAVGSGTGILDTLVRSGGSAPDTRAVVEMAQAGDAAALSAMHRSADAVGALVAGLVNCYDPDLVVVTGGVAAAQPWWERFVGAVPEHLLPALSSVPLRRSEVPHAACLGAARLWDDALWHQLNR